MANQLLTNDIILKLTLKNLTNNLGTVKVANKAYNKDFIAGVGSTVRVEYPVRFDGQTTSTITTYEDIEEREFDLSIDRIAVVGITLSQIELSRDITQFNQVIAKPISIRLANLASVGLMQEVDLGFNQIVGSTAPLSGFNPVDELKIRLNDMAIDWADMYCGLTPRSLGGVRQGTLGLFTPTENDRIVTKGTIGEYDGFSTYYDQTILRHATGTFGGTPLVAGGAQSGSTINLDGFPNSTANVLRAGDIISFAGVYYINPQSRTQYNYLAQFTVQADVTSSNTGTAAVTISPALEFNGPYQNASNAPADNAPVTLFGNVTPGTSVTYVKNIGFTKTGIIFVAPPRVRNPGAYYSKNETDPDTGINMCLNIDYTTSTNTNRYRFDVVYGAKALFEYGAILAAAA